MQKNNYTILYAEDEDITRANVAKSLEMECENVIQARDGQEAYELYVKYMPDMIITDIEMPKMDGLELIEKIRTKDTYIPIIVISAYSDKKKLFSAIRLNIVDYIVKPVSRASFREVLKIGFDKIKQNKKIDIAAYDKLSEAVLIFDNQNTIVACNEATIKMFGYDFKDDMLGFSAYSLVSSLHKHKIDEANQNDIYVNNEIYLTKKDSTIFMAKTQSKFSAIDSRKVRIVSVIDLSETIKYHILDHLTSLPTRKTLELDFTNLMQTCKVKKESACAIFVDIDNFKTINDSLGHQFGDRVIKCIANILIIGVRKSDIVVRWGGDEFLILLFDTPLFQAKKVALSLRKEVNKLSIDGYNNFTCSFGLDAIKTKDTLAKVTSRIDEALFEAKRVSKNCVIEYSSI